MNQNKTLNYNDNTIMGSADEGLAITTKGLFWKNGFSDSQQVSWQEIKRVSYDGEASKNLFVDEAKITLTLSDDKPKTFQALYLSLKKIARMAKNLPVELNLESFRLNLNDFIEMISKKQDVQEYIKDLKEIIPEKTSIGNSLIEEETRPENHSYDTNGTCQHCGAPREIAQILKVKCRQENENKSIETRIEDFQVADQNSLTVGSHIVVTRANNQDIQHGIWIAPECVVTFFCDNIKVKISDDGTVCSDTSIVKATFEEFARGAEVNKITHGNSIPLQVVKRCSSVLGDDGKKTFNTSKDFSLWCINGYKSPEIERFHPLEDEEDIIWLLGQKTVYKIEDTGIEWKDVQQLQFGSLLYLQSPYSSPLGNQFKHIRQLKIEEIEKMNIDKELALFLYFEKNPNAPEWILSHNSIKILDTQENILFSDIQSIEHDNNALLINTKSSCIHLPAKFLDLNSIASFLNAYIAMRNFDISKLQWNWAAKQKILTEMIIGGSICLVAT